MHALPVHAILFDLDGTLIDSTPGVLQAWQVFAADYGLDAADVAHKAHGRRLYDTLKEYCGIQDEEKLQSEIVRFEDLVIKGGPLVLPGALTLLNRIGTGPPEATSGWTIVTSATNVYAPRALERCGLPLPPLGLVTSNDVVHGKPRPDPYLAGARRLGVDPSQCLVVEDAPSGIAAGRAAGCTVVAVCTSHTRQALLAAGARPDYIVKDLTRLSARWIGEILEVSIDDD
ncbi:HAD family hydrolase [Phanerochaete sordida]|uniref:HAD family hydrolase n=1 Tax=Phanerochaete sordida TaxID=48140 RepID=A0A9P3G4S5_9APHY|nr:HAD family hydrolase [Phanerochaete sordida]